MSAAVHRLSPGCRRRAPRDDERPDQGGKCGVRYVGGHPCPHRHRPETEMLAPHAECG